MVLVPSKMLPLGTRLPSFELTDAASGSLVCSGDFAGAPLVVAIICNHCPYVKRIKAGLVALETQLARRGAKMVAVSANDASTHPADAPQEMKGDALNFGYAFPYLFDAQQELAKSLQAVCTPEFYVFDESSKLAYRGQMDEARPNNQAPNDARDILAALDRLVAREAPLTEQKPSIGCNIKWTPGKEPDYFR